MLPMECPKCRCNEHRATFTNGLLPDQIVRQRRCVDCGHKWHTVELLVPDYAVGWSKAHSRKPVLRVPMALEAGHTRIGVTHVEAMDQIEVLKLAMQRRSELADLRHSVKKREHPAA